jgi:tetratricopeptide (TPR) repeat protein
MDQIRYELSVWNNDSALALAEGLEQLMKNSGITTGPIVPELLFILARVHVIRAERKDLKAKDHIERAKFFLAQIDSISSASVGSEMEADIQALKGSIENLESGPNAALARLAERTDPYAIRIRLAILLNNRDPDGAVTLIKDLPPNDRWCDLAVTAFALKDCREDAEKLVKWAAVQKDRTIYPQCVVRLSDALFVRSLAGQRKGKYIQPHDLSEEEKNSMRVVLETLQPILNPIVASRQIDSELSTTAVKIAFQVNHLLGKREDVAKLAHLMYTRRPIPLEVARSVISGYIDPPPALPERLRKEYPGDLEANILAAVVQSSCMGQHREAFARAKELISLADTDKKKDKLFTLFEQLWQELEGDVAADCKRIAEALASHNSKNRVMFRAARALRAKDPDEALRALDEEKAEDDIYWLQLRGHALIQKGQLGEGVGPLLIAAKMTREPTLLHKTADLALRVEKTDIAVWCYERLLELQPNNLAARANLASIYAFDLVDTGKAAHQFRALHEAEPENPVHTVNLAICLAHLYRPQESLALYNKVCGQDNPDVRAVVGRAELYLSLGDADSALASLQSFRQVLWNNPDFLLAFMNTAYAAGNEEAAHEAFKALDNLRKTGGVEADAFRMIPADEGLEMLKTSMKRAQEKREHLHSEMLRGQMPWVWVEQVAGNAIYWGWRRRTQEIAWIGDDPVNRANFCVYATNAFHPRKSEMGRSELLPLESPPAGTRVVADISALITLHRLELLDIAADYFAEIIVPEGYLRTVLADGRKMVLSQRSQEQSAEQILKKTERGIITVLGEQAAYAAGMAITDEYGESEKHRYHLIDVIRPVHTAGIISDAEYERISKVSMKKSNVNETHPELARLQGIFVELSTLETLTHFGLLGAVTEYYKVHIEDKARTELRQRLEQIQYQQETRKWHFDLWERLRDNPRFRFVSHTFPKGMREMRKKNLDPNDYLPFLAGFVAREIGAPLLVDDRVCQVLALNERPEASHAAFGTDTVISSLLNAGKLDGFKAAGAMRRLIQWRYRFILPDADILKALAGQFRANPPGQALQEIGEYVHDCMRDTGLFTGPEKTDNHESMAMRLYLSWLSVISKFLISVWDDESFSDESAKRLTGWSIQELLPSSPRVLDGSIKARISSMTSKALLSHTLINSNILSKGKRMPDAMKALKDAFNLDDGEYFRIVTGIFNDTRRTEL